jgi:hypothetical protein
MLQHLSALALGTLGVHEQGNNETVKTQDFGENEDKNHSDEQPGLLGSSSYTSVTDDTNGETSGHTRQTDGQTGTELNEAGEEADLLLQTVGDQDRDDKTVDTNNTSHDDGNNVLDDQVRAEDTHGADTDTSLGGTVGGTEAGEDDGCCAAHRAEEGLVKDQYIARCVEGCRR